MRGRETNKGAPSVDLLACFPSRAHLTIMPKPICSPARPSEPNKRRHHHHHHHHLRKSSTRGDGGGQASPLLWVKNKQMGSEISEPTSPKVTCAGQIKVRPKTSSCKSWQSVMEEIERIHNSRQLKKRPSWVESLGFKKEIMHFLTCLRSIRFDFRCFGAFPQTDITSTDDEDGDYEEEEEEEDDHVGVGDDASSRTVFSKWFMVLQENQSTNNGFCKEKEKPCFDDEDHSVCEPSTAPPPNALLLMRCRSAPAKSWLEEKEEEEEEEEEIKEDDDHEEDTKKEEKKKDLRSLMEEEKRNKKENLVVMRYDTDFYKISSDIAKETWVNVGGTNDLLSRSRSWKR